ncbi:RNA ligase RtcB family protein [Litoribrevibacter euphylliae]|uniref:3'-phosphate/5'-hydroxy nucleic acid ligase n=1 Tax=Litoribrevibacter euphylliae TaxID=1834034 RepID=A0ABV7HL36_9GAMM
MGNSIQFIESGVRLIASERNWIEGDAIEQLKHVSRLEGMNQVVGLPDLHPGRGYPIGAACWSQQKIYPALVGNDIGCGMALYETSADANKVKQDKWEKALRKNAFKDQESWSQAGASRFCEQAKRVGLDEQLQANTELVDGFHHSYGTIGGGNHFAEFQKVIKVHNDTLFTELGINKKALFLLVHSGSRGLGEAILRQHVDAFGHQGLDQQSVDADNYLTKHNLALCWAEVNRELIAARMCDCLGLDLTEILDVNHNLVSPVSVNGQTGWLHRKGVTPADQGVVMIPGSRGSSSYLVKPIVSDVSLSSLAHGAGRKWVRSECQGRLRKKYRISELQRTSLGSRVICDDKSLIYEEAPEAYKSIDIVVADLVAAGLAEIIAEFAPVITYKNVYKEACCK